MTNAWKVQWKHSGKKLVRTFEGDKPADSGALDFAKQLKNQGFSDVALISKRRAFAPPAGSKGPLGFIWCPYCVRWREFATYAIERNGLVGPESYRCMVCSITSENYWVRKYNSSVIRRQELELEIKSTMKRAGRRGNNISSVRRS